MRVFVPLTRPALRAALQAGVLPGGTAFAVTPALREWYTNGDEEHLEEVARALASVGSLRLIALDPSAPPQRVVVAVEADARLLDGPDAGPDDIRGAVSIDDVPLSHWAAALLDGPEAEEVVAAAADAVLAADLGDPDAEITLGDAEDVELLWFGIQELVHEL